MACSAGQLLRGLTHLTSLHSGQRTGQVCKFLRMSALQFTNIFFLESSTLKAFDKSNSNHSTLKLKVTKCLEEYHT